MASIDRTLPGSMTAFIRQEGLLDAAEIDAIVAEAPADLLDFQRVAAPSRLTSA